MLLCSLCTKEIQPTEWGLDTVKCKCGTEFHINCIVSGDIFKCTHCSTSLLTLHQKYRQVQKSHCVSYLKFKRPNPVPSEWITKLQVKERLVLESHNHLNKVIEKKSLFDKETFEYCLGCVQKNFTQLKSDRDMLKMKLMTRSEKIAQFNSADSILALDVTDDSSSSDSDSSSSDSDTSMEDTPVRPKVPSPLQAPVQPEPVPSPLQAPEQPEPVQPEPVPSPLQAPEQPEPVQETPVPEAERVLKPGECLICGSQTSQLQSHIVTEHLIKGEMASAEQLRDALRATVPPTVAGRVKAIARQKQDSRGKVVCKHNGGDCFRGRNIRDVERHVLLQHYDENPNKIMMLLLDLQ